MATTRGCFGVLRVGADAVGELRTWELNETAERIDASVMGDCTRKYAVGPVEATGTFTCFLDDSDTAQAALSAGGTASLELWPAGQGSGLPARNFDCNIEQIAERAAVDGLVERDYSYVATTAVDRTAQT